MRVTPKNDFERDANGGSDTCHWRWGCCWGRDVGRPDDPQGDVLETRQGWRVGRRITVLPSPLVLLWLVWIMGTPVYWYRGHSTSRCLHSHSLLLCAIVYLSYIPKRIANPSILRPLFFTSTVSFYYLWSLLPPLSLFRVRCPFDDAYYLAVFQIPVAFVAEK